jgi:glycosyltransferase involved in cell wall biosynthesis
MPSQNSQILITIFTPAYNRAHLLPRLYESLCAQSFHSFEWLIVDDGSKDNTEKVVNAFIAEDKLNIRYIKQSNGGKHRAINHGVKEARGELFFIVDSDDYLSNNALERIDFYFIQIKKDNSFAGVSGTRIYKNGKRIGGDATFTVLDISYVDLSFKYHINGDMAEVYRTVIMRKYPFPDFEGERFCTEGLVWDRIAKKYKLRYFNEGIYICEYLPGGLTSGSIRLRMNNPIGSMTYYSELIVMEIPFIQKIKAAINYWRFRFCDKKKTDMPQISFAWIWTSVLGYMMHLKDLRK